MKARGDHGMPLEVLLVEDSPGDVRLTQEALREAHPALHLHVTTDGVEAMAFLNRQGIHAQAPRPDLILLDLNLPKMDGREVLAHIKDDPSLKLIPTVILTTSDAEADIVDSYRLQANCYLSKPVQLDAFEGLVKSINDFWLMQVKLPQQVLGPARSPGGTAAAFLSSRRRASARPADSPWRERSEPMSLIGEN